MANDGPGVIGQGITIRGNLSGSEPLIIKGVVEGTISLDNHLTVETTGKLVADIDVETVTVHGEMEGNINAQEMVAICAGAKVVGNVSAPRVVIDDGAVFKGARYSRYRVWCLQELRSHYLALPDEVQATARQLLENHACWEPLWRHERLPLLPGQEEHLPFRADTKMVGVNE